LKFSILGKCITQGKGKLRSDLISDSEDRQL